MIEYHFDGYTISKNPSPVGGGFTIVAHEQDDTGQSERLIFTHKILRNPVLFRDTPFTNNEAELLGGVFAAAMAPDGAKLITDSKNTEAWLASGNPKARPDLKWLCVLGAALIKTKDLTLEWRPRERNLAGNYNEFTLKV